MLNDTGTTELLNQFREELKVWIHEISDNVTKRLDAQTRLLSDIKQSHPIEKKAHTRIGKFLQKITRIEVMAVIIASLQLIIAFPQLQIAYNSLVNDETGNLKDAFNDFVTHTDEIALIQIPDTLTTREIEDIRSIQQVLFFNLKLLSQSDFAFEIKSKKPNEVCASIQNILLRMIEIGNCCQRINQIEQSLYETYFPQDNSAPNASNITLNSHNAIQRIMLLYISTEKITNLKQIQDEINSDLEKCAKEIKYNIVNRAQNIEKFKSYFENNMPFEKYAQYLRLQDELGIAFVNVLNQVQYSMAYNIEL